MIRLSELVEKYKVVLRESSNVRGVGKTVFLGGEGTMNRQFVNSIVSDRELFVKFLREGGLIKSEIVCRRCGEAMQLVKRRDKSDGYMWRCVGFGKGCHSWRSIRFNSWFSMSKLTMEEIFLLSYEVMGGESSSKLIKEYSFGSNTLADWRQFIREALLDFIELNSEKIGGPGKIVEVDESKFGKRKYNRGKRVEGQWVFGGVERGSGRVFMVAVHDRCADTLVGLIKEWILPGTTIYSDSWKGYKDLGEEGFEHLRVNHSVSFVGEGGVHTNTIESTWRHVKGKLPQYNRKIDFEFILSEILFDKFCAFRGEDKFNKFLEIVREINWDEVSVEGEGDIAVAGPSSAE